RAADGVGPWPGSAVRGREELSVGLGYVAAGQGRSDGLDPREGRTQPDHPQGAEAPARALPARHPRRPRRGAHGRSAAGGNAGNAGVGRGCLLVGQGVPDAGGDQRGGRVHRAQQEAPGLTGQRHRVRDRLDGQPAGAGFGRVLDRLSGPGEPEPDGPALLHGGLFGPAVAVDCGGCARHQRGFTVHDRQEALMSATKSSDQDIYPIGAVVGSSGAGKMVSLSTIIPTPDGYTTMGDVEPGHEVIGRDGRPVRVAAKSPVKTRPDLYRVTFSDGQSVLADYDHQWVVSDYHDRHGHQTTKRANAVESWKMAHAA